MKIKEAMAVFQKAVFQTVKGGLSGDKRRSFAMQKVISWKTK